MNTKEKILEKALTLFAEKGYSAVYVADIAKEVGIKAPSIYKHFKNKQQIFDSCIEVFYTRMREMTDKFTILDDLNSKMDPQILMDEFLEITKRVFLFHLKDEVASKLRKMLTIERFSNEKLNMIYEELFLEEPIRFETGLFESLMSAGILKESNPTLLAYRYYSPIFFLLTKYDMHNCKADEAFAKLQLLSREFYENNILIKK